MFPTSAEIASFMRLLQMQGLERRICALRPDLADLTYVENALNAHVRIELPPDRRGNERAVAVGQVRHSFDIYWLIAGGKHTEIVSQVWPIDAENDHLAAATVEVWDACLHDRALRLPWRWGQPMMSDTVEMAEALTAAGLTVDAVAAHNRLVPHEIEGDSAPVTVPPSLGDAIRVKTGWGVATVWRKPSLGWVVDANDHLETRRLELPVSNRPSAGEDVDTWRGEFASAVEVALRQSWKVKFRFKTRSNVSSFPRWPAHEAVAWWLAELKLGDVYVRDDARDRPEFYGDVYPLLAQRCGLGALQRAFAKATVARKPLVAFATQGFTRDAERWGEDAGVLCFNLGGEGDDFWVGAATAHAAEYVPGVI